jgi:hypothetical protein
MARRKTNLYILHLHHIGYYKIKAIYKPTPPKNKLISISYEFTSGFLEIEITRQPLFLSEPPPKIAVYFELFSCSISRNLLA